MGKVLDYCFEGSEIKLQLCYYIHFQTNTLWKGIEPIYPPNYELNIISAVLLQGWLLH